MGLILLPESLNPILASQTGAESQAFLEPGWCVAARALLNDSSSIESCQKQKNLGVEHYKKV